ncbi:TetR/AcrR family transcriptional regulator [Serratia marcescens]|uniref:TetR/AcrR family transcriptional regulator n=1 Tax=Serratia marcescens TaxID=615 RepID=UPI003A89B17F
MPDPLSPRKQPVQRRSAVTVAALHTATIQVLTREGLNRCTTTRVAGRAGMSVGSLYQYYPNRDALLAAVLEQHLGGVATAVEEATLRARGKEIAVMARALVAAFVGAKLHDPQASKALYSVASERNGAQVAARMHQRMNVAVSQMLVSAKDARFATPAITAAIAIGAMAGPVRALLEGQTSPETDQALVAQLSLLLQAYFQSAGHGEPPGTPGRSG